MKKLLLIAVSVCIAASSAYADEKSLDKSIANAINAGMSVKEIVYSLKGDFGANAVLGALSMQMNEGMQQAIIKVAQEVSPHYVAVLTVLAGVDSKVVRMEKPTHEEVARHRDTEDNHAGESTSVASNTDFNPNDLPATATGDDNTLQLASLDDSTNGTPDSVSP